MMLHVIQAALLNAFSKKITLSIKFNISRCRTFDKPYPATFEMLDKYRLNITQYHRASWEVN